jgi:hypothetical protein
VSHRPPISTSQVARIRIMSYSPYPKYDVITAPAYQFLLDMAPTLSVLFVVHSRLPVTHLQWGISFKCALGPGPPITNPHW